MFTVQSNFILNVVSTITVITRPLSTSNDISTALEPDQPNQRELDRYQVVKRSHEKARLSPVHKATLSPGLEGDRGPLSNYLSFAQRPGKILLSGTISVPSWRVDPASTLFQLTLKRDTAGLTQLSPVFFIYPYFPATRRHSGRLISVISC